MAMDKQTRTILERLAAIEAKLDALGTDKTITLEATAEAGEIEIPQLDEIEAKLDTLLALLTPPASAGEAKTPAKPAKGIGENKS